MKPEINTLRGCYNKSINQ